MDKLLKIASLVAAICISVIVLFDFYFLIDHSFTFLGVMEMFAHAGLAFFFWIYFINQKK